MLALGPAHPSITLLEDNAVAKKTQGDGYRRTAASEATLSGGGLHTARFTVRKGSDMMFGVIGADWDVKGGKDAQEVLGHCFYHTGDGQRYMYPGSSGWTGMQGSKEAGDCIDLLLDLGVGSMAVFKNGEPLGVMQESGLGGAGVEYRWAVGLYYYGDSARIDAVPAHRAAEVEALMRALKAREAQRERERLSALEKGAFFPAHPSITLLEDNAVAKKTQGDGYRRTAASEATLSGGGLHTARFTVRKGSDMMFGVIGADWDVQGGDAAWSVLGHCFYYTHNWEGTQTASEEGDRIDLLLGASSMFVAKNGELLGAIQKSGLGGAGVEYRWAVALYGKGSSARIDVVPAAEVEALMQAHVAHVAQREREREEQEAREEERLAALEKGVFFPAHPDITLLEGNAVAKLTKWDGSWRIAASEAILGGAGLHAARFTVRKGSSTMYLGVIGADWNVEGGEDAHEVHGHCFYSTAVGCPDRYLSRYPGGSYSEGMQTASEEGDRIELLLDLGTGSMAVFKNGEPLGAIQKSGLGGAGVEYRWAVALYYTDASARIDAVPAAEVEALVQVREAHVAQVEWQRLEQEAQAERQRLARIASEQDLTLPAGTRLRIHGHASDGVYERWERRTFGANAHFIDFGAEGGGVQQVALKGLSPSQLSVLPPLVVTVRVVEITGTETVEVEGVSLGWSVSRLNATIAERRGASAELQRLVVGDAALDDMDALLSSCGVGEGTLVHIMAQTKGAVAERAAAAAAVAAAATDGPPAAGTIAEGQPPQQRQQRRGGNAWCCASPAYA
jgi:hypothetical protein